MLKQRLLICLTLLSGIMLLSTSCRKIIDKYFPHHPGSPEAPCRISTVRQSLFTDGIDRSGHVYYNNHGDPDSVIFDLEIGSSGPAYFYFTYNEHHRLLEYRADYSRDAGDYYAIHRYGYENGRIVHDTGMFRVAGVYVTATDLSYDSQGRIISETGKVISVSDEPASEPLDPITFTYDAAGNLVGPAAYDNKVNYLRTHPVWTFIERDYSVNNPSGATGYNEEGLPTGFGANHSGGGFLTQNSPRVIEYDCAK